MNGTEPERDYFSPGPHHCDQCKETFQQTPWAFPLMDLRFPEEHLRFCSERCLNEYRRTAQAPPDTKGTER